MGFFSWSMQLIKRSSGRSVVAAAAYRAGECLWDERAGVAHDYRRRSGVEHAEILAPPNAPAWVFAREDLWNEVEAVEKRKDAQLARELRFAIPREIPSDDRVAVVRDYLQRTFVDRGMIADFVIHNKEASDGAEQPHVHVLLTLRPLEGDGFGRKSRHDWVPDPEGRTHPDGRPVMVVSNADSWNSPAFFDQCRLNWEDSANDALARAGSEARVDRRSLLERGLSRLPEPALRLAWYMRDLYGCMKDRFGHYQTVRHYRVVEQASKDAFRKLDATRAPPLERKHTSERFFGWFDRQLARLQPAPAPRPPDRGRDPDPSLGFGR